MTGEVATSLREFSTAARCRPEEFETSAVDFAWIGDPRPDMVFLDDFTVPGGCGDSECSPHERAIEGPATKPTAAPATAPIGPKTNAPDTAPSAALPTRSLANAPDGTPQTTISTATTILFMCVPFKPRRKSTPSVGPDKGFCWARQRCATVSRHRRAGHHRPPVVASLRRGISSRSCRYA